MFLQVKVQRVRGTGYRVRGTERRPHYANHLYPRASMRAAALRIEVHIPTAQSLKEKRAVVRPVIEGIRKLGSYSVAEVAHQDSWQRAVLGVALVTRDAGTLDTALTALHRYLDNCLEIEVVDVQEYQLEERD